MSTARVVGRNTVFTAVGRISVLLVWFLLTPTILRVLGVERFGLWSLLLVISGSLATIDLGLGVAITRYLAELAGGERADEIPRLVLRASALQVAIAAVLVAPGILLRGPILHSLHVPDAWMPEARSAFTWTLLAFAAGMVSNLMLGALQGLQRMDVAARVLVPAALALAVAIVFAMRSTTPLVRLVEAQCAYSVVVALALFAFVVRAHPAGAGSTGPGMSLRRVLRFGGWLQVTSLLALVQTQLDKFLLGWFVALAPVGVYELAWRGSYFVSLAPLFFLGALLPAATRIGAGAGEEVQRGVYRRILEPYLFAVGVLTALVFALAPAILEAWLRTPPPHAAFVLRVLVLAQAMNLFTGAASTMARVAERPALETRYLGLAVVLHAALSAGGLLLLGWRGVAVGYLASAAVAAAWFIARSERMLGLPPLRETARALVPALASSLPAAALAMAAPLLIARAAPGRVHGLFAMGLGAAAFAAVLVAILGLVFPGRAGALLRHTRAFVRP